MGCLTSARAKNQLALCRGATIVRLDRVPMRRPTGALLVARVLVNSPKLHLVVVVIVVTVVIDVVVVVVLVVVVLV